MGELWHTLGEEGYVSLALWPTINPEKYDKEILETMSGYQRIEEDIKRIAKVMKITPREIATVTGLAESTVRSALSRIFGLPPKMRPRIQRRANEDERGRREEYRFARIIQILFEE